MVSSDGWISYYKQEKVRHFLNNYLDLRKQDVKPAGKIPVNNITSVEIETDPLIFKAKSTPSQNLFRVNVNGSRKFYLFSVETPKEMDEWIAVLRHQLTSYKKRKDSIASHLGLIADEKEDRRKWRRSWSASDTVKIQTKGKNF